MPLLSPSTSRNGVAFFQRAKHINDGESVVVRRTKVSSRTPLHTHDFYEIAVVFGGYGTHLYGTVLEDIRPGDVLFVNPSVPHQFRNRGKTPLITDTVVFTEEIFETVLAEPEIADVISLFFTRGQKSDTGVPRIRLHDESSRLDDTYVWNIFRTMSHEYAEEKDGYQTVLKGYLLVLLTEFWRRFKASTDYKIGSASWQRLLPAIQELYETAGEFSCVSNLAALTGWSENHFSKLFHKATGQSVRDFALRLRVQSAALRLLTTDESIQEVAGSAGYKSSRSLRRAFIKCFGMTPSEYRKADRQRAD